MITLIFLVFVELPVRIEIAIDVKSSELEDRFTSLQPPPGAGDLHTIFDEVTASTCAHARGDRVSLGQGERLAERRRMIGQRGGAWLNRFALLRAQSLHGRDATHA